MTKTEAAFIFSVQRLFAQYSKIYFWTFTLTKVYPDWYYSQCWAHLVRDLHHLYSGNIGGVRVIELHKNHGIHWHCLLNQRVWVGEVRRIGERYGFGRVHVKVADENVASYLLPYIKKDIRQGNEFFGGCARWGTVGTFKGLRVRDVEVESRYHSAIKRCQEATGVRRFPWLFVSALKHSLAWPYPPSDFVMQRAARHFVRTGSISGMWDPEKPSFSKEQREQHLKALKVCTVVKGSKNINSLCV